MTTNRLIATFNKRLTDDDVARLEAEKADDELMRHKTPNQSEELIKQGYYSLNSFSPSLMQYLNNKLNANNNTSISMFENEPQTTKPSFKR